MKYIVEMLVKKLDGACLFPRWFIYPTDYVSLVWGWIYLSVFLATGIL